MIIKSIKWRLQLWYGIILVTVLAGFGVTAYQLERSRMFRRVDDEIHRHIDVVVQQFRHPPRGPRPGRFPEGRPPPEFPDDNLPPDMARPPRFNVTPQLAAMFDTNSPDQFYFIAWGPRGDEIGRSGNAPEDSSAVHLDAPFVRQNQLPDLPYNSGHPKYDGDPNSDAPPGPRIPEGQPLPQNHGMFREIHIFMPTGEQVLVGRSVKPELAELQVTTLTLAGFGGAILFVGFAGGWIFISRALRPISYISSTAAKISAGDLSQRISAAETQSELGQLAAVLNSTFARLETAFAQQKQFASDAAHELRTPVSVILTQTQLALSRERDAAAYRQTVEACQRAAQRMRKLIESLLELARFDAGQEVLKHFNFDFSTTVAESAELVQPLAHERAVKIVTELAPLKITGDSERLAQVVTNLLTNAIQYNRPDGVAHLRLEARNGLAVLEISDTGKGIATADLPHVFERFYRADKSRTGACNSGLGLSICKAIVEAHGGTIEAANIENSGAMFVVRIPIGA